MHAPDSGTRVSVLISLANPKGGVGKTTIAVHLAIRSQEKGRTVAFIDADGQQSSTGWLTDLKKPFPIHRFRTREDVIDHVDAIVESAEVTIADGPAGLSEVTASLIMASDLVLLPCGPSILDLRALQDALKVVRHAQKLRKGPPHACLIPNKLQAGYRLSRELLEAAESMGIPHLSGMRLRQAYADAASRGTVVWRIPRSEDASEEFFSLYDQIAQHERKAIT
jgi:chromosome partitioning protein